MKEVINGIIKVLDRVYGWGIIICLFGGGLTFFGFLVAFVIGGEVATMICVFIQEEVFGYLIYGGNIIVCLGLFSMYLKKQKSLTVSDENREAS